jgi:hypothetical protein
MIVASKAIDREVRQPKTHQARLSLAVRVLDGEPAVGRAVLGLGQPSAEHVEVLAGQDGLGADVEDVADGAGEDGDQDEHQGHDRTDNGDLVAGQSTEGDPHRRLAGDLLGA